LKGIGASERQLALIWRKPRATRARFPVRIAVMPVLTAGNTVYTRPVAKVMISISDDLLERLDAQARANQETRSGFLQRLAQRELEEADGRMREEVDRLLGRIGALELGDNADVDSAQLIREDRESH
jgi:nuclear transport factor 2 (NTF2) superfamily protein